MFCPMIDPWSKTYLTLLRDNPAVVDEARGMIARGDKQKVVALELAMPLMLVSAIKQAMDPASDTSKRIAEWQKWRKWKDAQIKEKRERVLIDAREKKKRRELRGELFKPGDSYEDFVKRMRGEAPRQKRIELLDYSDEMEARVEGLKDGRAPKLYRKVLRELLPIHERAAILARLAKSEDDGIALRAMQILHKLEGVERKPVEQKADWAPGPMFSLAGGIGVQLAPVDAGETKH